MFEELAQQLGATATRGTMPDGLAVSVAYGDLDAAEFDALGAQGQILLRYHRERGAPDDTVHAALVADAEIRDAYTQGFGAPPGPDAIGVDNTVVIRGPGPKDATALARLLRRVDALARSADPSDRRCWSCGEHAAPLAWEHGSVRRVCPRCSERIAGWVEREQALHGARVEADTGTAYPPLSLPGDLTPERLDALNARLEADYQANPALYRAQLLAWVALGQAAMLGGALLLIGGLLALGAGTLGALYIGAGVLLIKVLLLAKGATKLIGAAVVGAGALLSRFAGSITSLFGGGGLKFEDVPGQDVDRADAPGLYAWLDQLADEVGAPRVDRVVVDTRINAFASERRVSRFRHERIVGVGLPLLDLLDPDEFRAVMAHELGHLRNQDARTLWVYRAAHDWIELGWQLASDEGGLWFSRWYVPRFLIRARVVGREHERQADREAARVVGPDACARALVKVHAISAVAGDALNRGLSALARTDGAADPPLGAVLRGGLAALPAAELVDAQRRALDERPHWLDTHPPLSERCALLGQTPDAAAALVPPVTASTLFPDLDPLRERLSGNGPRWLGLQVDRIRVREGAARLRAARLREAVATRPPDPRRHAALASYLSELHDTSGAADELRRAAELVPDDPRTRALLVGALFTDHRDDAAAAEARAVLAAADLGIGELMPCLAAFERTHDDAGIVATLDRVLACELPDAYRHAFEARRAALTSAVA